MDDCTIKWDILFQGTQAFVILFGALWAYFRFFREGPLQARIEFSVDCKFLGPQCNSYLTSIVVSANNKGNVEHKFSQINLRVLGIKSGEAFRKFDGHPHMVAFPEELMKGVNIIPGKMQYYFVRPGVSQSFNFVTQVPEDIRFIVVRATFKYQNTNDLHTAEQVFEVKPDTKC
jgi:hypothetical protein